MSNNKIIVIIILCALVGLGWFSYFENMSATRVDYDSMVSQADEWYSDGLYERAILMYEEVLEVNPSVGVCDKMLASYEALCQEDDNQYAKYRKALISAIEKFPESVSYVQMLTDLYLRDNMYQQAYDCLAEAEIRGAVTKELLQTKLKLKYMYTIKTATYTEYQNALDSTYSVSKGGIWGTVNLSGNTKAYPKYEYVGPGDSKSVQVFTESGESRLKNSKGMTLGIFAEKITCSGIFSCGLIAAAVNDNYAYYDEFANRVMGDYELAGNFYADQVAVKKDGSSYVINTTGEQVSQTYADIVLDQYGFFNRQDIILAAKTEGSYNIYDQEWNQISDFSCHSMDICTGDKIIAYEVDGKWGFVDSEGNIVITPQYEAARSFSNGLAGICINGKWGFIDRENHVVIDCLFEDVDYFNSEGACMVCTASDNENAGRTWQLLVLKVKGE